jgi:hypothetical protein
VRTLIAVIGLLVLVGLVGGGIFMIARETGEASVALQSTDVRTAQKRRVFGRRAGATEDEGWKTLAGTPMPSSGVSGAAGARDRATGGSRSGSGRGSAGSPAGGSPEDRYRPDEVLAANPPAGFDEAVSALGFQVREISDLRYLGLRLYRLRTPPRTTVPAAVQALRGRFPGTIADANHLYEVTAGLALPESYARALIGWRSAPADCGRGVRLGMIDTGVELQHPALNGADIDYRIFNNPGRSPAPPDHGTAIASMMVGKPAKGKGWGGLLPGARLIAANIFEIEDSGAMLGSASGFLKAIDWMAESHVHAVNMSIAGPDNQVVRLAMGRARWRGLIMVAAAGNNGSTAEPAYPAAYPDVIAVTAIDAEKHVYKYANRGGYIDFAAPGVRIWTASPGGGRYQSGTSFASPYVSVLSALAVAEGQRPQPDNIRALLQEDVIDLGAPGRDSTFGWGLVGTEARCGEVNGETHG